MNVQLHLVKTVERVSIYTTTTFAHVLMVIMGRIAILLLPVPLLVHRFMGHFPRPITMQEALFLLPAIVDISFMVLRLVHAKEEYGQAVNRSVQTKMSVTTVRAISGAQIRMEDTSAIVMKATNFRDPLHVLISTNAPFLTEAVPTRVITPRDHSLVPAQLAWSWILGKGVAQTSMNVHLQMAAVSTPVSTPTSLFTVSAGKDTLLRQIKQLVKRYHVPV